MQGNISTTFMFSLWQHINSKIDINYNDSEIWRNKINRKIS